MTGIARGSLEKELNARPKYNWYGLAALALGAGVIVVLLFLNARNGPCCHDEEQYVYGGVLAVQGSLYRDFVHLQPPYHPIILSAVFQFFDERYLLVARMVTFVLSLGSVLLMYLLGLRITRSAMAAAAIAALFLTSEIVLGAFGSARNDIMPCFFALLAVYLVSLAESRERFGRALYLLAGLAAAISVGTKLLYAFVPAVLFLFLLLRNDRPFGARLRGMVIPLVGGGVLGSLPIVYFAWIGLDGFLYGVVTFHTTATSYWYTTFLGREDASLLRRLITSTRLLLRDGVTIVCLVISFFVFCAAFSSGSWRTLRNHIRRPQNALIVALMLFSLPLVMAPYVSLTQYYIPFVPFSLLLVACLYGWIEGFQRGVAAPLLVAAVLAAAAPGLFVLAKNASQPATVDKVYAISTNIRSALSHAGLKGKVATLSPIFVIDAGLPAYSELATGPFFYRTADLLPPETVRALKAVSPETLYSLLDADPPAAIFTGYQTISIPANTQDSRFEAYARSRGYRRVSGAFGKGKLFLRPSR